MKGKHLDALLLGICGLAVLGGSIRFSEAIGRSTLDGVQYYLSVLGIALLLWGIVPLGKNGRQKGALIGVILGAALFVLGALWLGGLLMLIGIVAGTIGREE